MGGAYWRYALPSPGAAPRRPAGHAGPGGDRPGRTCAWRRTASSERGAALAAAPGEEVLDLGGRAGPARPRQRPHAPLQRAGPGHAGAAPSARATSSRSWSASGGGSTARWTRSRSTSPRWWAAIEAARSGTTLLVDHHSSPVVHPRLPGHHPARAGGGRVALGALLRGHRPQRREGRDAGVEENRDFAAHASALTARPDRRPRQLHALRGEPGRAGARPSTRRGGGVHIHVAEDRADVEDCRARYGASVPERLDAPRPARPARAARALRAPLARGGGRRHRRGAPGSRTTRART